MAMKDEDKAELTAIMSAAFVEGLKTFRSETEEEAAKAQQTESEKKNEPSDAGKVGNGFSFRGWLLGE
jgi:hypothetical protein